MQNFLLPSKVEFQPGETPHSGSLVVMPCYHGYGTTLGNAFRRVLLSSLPGAAVESFKVKGVQHEFSAVDGIKEDAIEIMLNLKQLAVKLYGEEPVTLHLTKKGTGEVTARDIEPNSSVEILNPDMVIAHVTGSKTFEMDIAIGHGLGYRPVQEKDRKNQDLGTILTDSVYTPIKDVGYKVEYTRVGDITNFEKLTLNIETNGTISPEEAIQKSAQILMDHFTVILQNTQAAIQTPHVTAPAMIKESSEELEVAEEEPVKKPKRVSKKKS